MVIILKKNKIIIILGVLITTFVISLVFPTKFCLEKYPSSTENDFLIVRHDNLKNWWIIAGDENGLYDWNTVSDIPVTIKGKNINNIISSDLYLNNMPTYFVLYGEIQLQEQYSESNGTVSYNYTINCTNWDILENIYSRNKFRTNFSRKYLTVYDYKWFDNFRKLIYDYEEL